VETAAIVWGLAGICGIWYTLEIARRLRKQTSYQAVFEDWLFHVLLPVAAYLALAVSACAAGSFLRPALLSVAAATLLLLFTGIHNAWDAVIYHVFVRNREKRGGHERHRRR